jgi:hypothetical protein
MNIQRPLREIALDMADNGGWEVFYQRFDSLNLYMAAYHKQRRLKLTAEYRSRVAAGEPAPNMWECACNG